MSLKIDSVFPNAVAPPSAPPPPPPEPVIQNLITPTNLTSNLILVILIL